MIAFMNNATIKMLSASARKLVKANKATGPRSEQGKLRSAMNATKHGLSGRHLLLPGEDLDAYASKMDSIFTTFSPSNEAEAQLVALIADDLHKLDRLERIDTGITLGRIEQLLAQTSAAEKAGKTAMALTALGSALQLWEQAPVPMAKSPELERRRKKMMDAIAIVTENVIEVPIEMVTACEPFLLRLGAHRDWEDGNFSPLDYQALGEKAGKLMGWLLAEGDRDEGAQEELRKAIACIALPDELELKKLARYRKLLEDGLQRRLQALKMMRELTAGKQVEDQDQEQARAFRVQLRLVR